MSKQAPNDQKPEQPSDDPSGDAPDLPTNQTVLVVEDDLSAQKLMRWFLPETYEVKFVASASAAHDALTQHSYDLVLMDIDLGGKRSGIDVLNDMPEEAVTTTKVLAVTAYAMPGDRERLLDAGFDGYLAKPFTRARFLGALAGVLRSDDE